LRQNQEKNFFQTIWHQNPVNRGNQPVPPLAASHFLNNAVIRGEGCGAFDKKGALSWRSSFPCRSRWIVFCVDIQKLRCTRHPLLSGNRRPAHEGFSFSWNLFPVAPACRPNPVFMRLRRITLQHFRNVPFAELAFEGRQQFFVGANAQGKTNLLEAVGFVSALRSFRTTDARLLIAHGQAEAALACEFEHERLGLSKLVITLRAGGKEVWCDGEKVTRLGDYLGRFPTVVFSSQDQQWVRGAPGLRRRWLDFTLAAMDPAYLRALQAYHKALAERNALLKRGAGGGELGAFEKPLAAAAAEVQAKRTAGLTELDAHLTCAYAQIADGAERAGLRHVPDTTAENATAWLGVFERGRARDLQFRTTLAGPHRDDFLFLLEDRPARDFGSEGQQRSLVLALRLAQVSYFRSRSGVEPLLLADDVLGELDSARRRRFWATLGESRQVIATGTALPDAELGAWEVWRVSGGVFTREAA
jgi:DNA replication and repair protein RecF